MKQILTKRQLIAIFSLVIIVLIGASLWKMGKQKGEQHVMSSTSKTMENVNPTTHIAKPVDLGLSVKWASFNVGASKPEEYGGLYGWGDVTGRKTSTDNDQYPTANPPKNISGTKYDIARKKWGKSWRLPTRKEQKELLEKCKWRKSNYKGVKGYTVTGPNGNKIFLPAVGGRIKNKTYYQVDGADYWSGTLSANKEEAYYLYYYIGEPPTLGTLPRHYCFAVRAVHK